jgi:hypothetical protein
MTNGIAIGLNDIVARDYWYNGTSCSGYSFKGKVTETCLKNFLNRGYSGFSNWNTDMFEEYSPYYTLAVPEQLVWWGEDDQEV